METLSIVDLDATANNALLQAREELLRTVELLRENLRCSMSEQDSPSDGSLVRRTMAEVLAFDPTKKKVN